MYVYIVSKIFNGSENVDKVFNSMEEAKEYAEKCMTIPVDYGDGYYIYETLYDNIIISRRKVD